jgi:hypothetical protein
MFLEVVDQNILYGEKYFKYKLLNHLIAIIENYSDTYGHPPAGLVSCPRHCWVIFPHKTALEHAALDPLGGGCPPSAVRYARKH